MQIVKLNKNSADVTTKSYVTDWIDLEVYFEAFRRLGIQGTITRPREGLKLWFGLRRRRKW